MKGLAVVKEKVEVSLLSGYDEAEDTDIVFN